MCGRFVINIPLDLFLKFFGLKEAPELPPRFNIAPTQSVLVIREAADGSRYLSLARWGLITPWSKEADDGLINARSETVNEKPSFCQAFRQRRCIIPASGFFEWSGPKEARQPWFISAADGGILLFAGLYGRWRNRRPRL